MDEKRVRVRLKFQEPDIFTSQQLQEGLAQSWYLVLLDDVHTIADVAFDLQAAFRLEESCPNGLSLEVDGFVLPASQPARLLKDSDLIRIKRRTDMQGQISQEIKNMYAIRTKEWLANDGLQKSNGYHGVDLRALDEFEKETGGYESEQEEGEMETDFSLDGEVKIPKEIKPSPTSRKEEDRSGKTHKRWKTFASEVRKSTGAKDLDVGQDLAIVQVKDKCNPVVNCGASQNLVVERHALHELEKETGKDKEAENGTVAVFSGKGQHKRKKLEATSQSPLGRQERRKNKRKKKEASMEGECLVSHKGQEGPCSDGVQCTVEHIDDGEHKLKRKKLKHSGLNAVEADCEDRLKEGITSSGKKKKKKDSNKSCEVMEGMLKTGTAVDKVGGKKRNKEADLESQAGTLRHTVIRASEGSIPARTLKSKVNDESKPAWIPKNERNTTVQEQRPSRSARRKKAKRQWLREQAKMVLLAGAEAQVSERNQPAVQTAQRDLDVPLVSEEVLQVEAEEEVVPIVVRAGHIRFEPYDNDEAPDQSRSSMPVLLLGDQMKTKRQGQNWGQERTDEKHKGKRWIAKTSNVQSPGASGDTRVNTRSQFNMDPASLEKYPALNGSPQEGDVLAYRVVELTTSWTPEISPYRVGTVAHWEQATNVIKVDPYLDYPSPGRRAYLEDGEDLWSEQGMQGVGPYDENGMLEIEFSALVEVRLIERVQSKNDEVFLGPSVEIGKEVDPNTGGSHQANNSKSEPVAEIGENAPPGQKQRVEDGDTVEHASAWQALVTEELERKKVELCQRDADDTNASTGTVAPSEPLENGTVGSEGSKLLHQPKAGRDRKYKFLRSAGVGSIVALLRAQQAL